MEERLEKHHNAQNSEVAQVRNTAALESETTAEENLPITPVPIDIVAVMLNKPVLCCVLDVRVRSHLERILAAALDAYESGDASQAVKLLRLFIQRVNELDCELEACLQRAVSHAMEIIRLIATTNMAAGSETILKDAEELRAEGQVEAASAFYERTFDTAMASMSLSEVAVEYPKPPNLHIDAGALVALPTPKPLPVPDTPVKPTTRDRPQEEKDDDDANEGEDGGNPDRHKGDAIDEEEAFKLDGELAALEFGWTPDAAEAHMRRQRAFNRFMAATIDVKYGDVLAGSAMARNPGEAATIWFKGKAPEEVYEMVRSFEESGLPIDVVDGMKFSLHEQEERMDRLAMVLAERGYKGVGATVLPGDIIQLTLPASEDCPESKPETKSDAGEDEPEPPIPDPRDGLDPMAARLLPESVDPYGIQVVCTSKVDEIDVDLHARGGRQVWGGGSQCTSGFSVYRISDGRTGIATAAHCTGMANFDAEAPESDFAMFHRGEHCGAHGDVEWKTTAHWEPAEYWANVNDRRNVNSVETWYSNNNVYCVYSRMQGTRRCDRVYSHSTNQYGCSAMGGVTAKRLVAMDNNRAIGGDSGGPWSYSTEAAGVVKGYKTIWFKRRDTFTKATRFDEALGVYVRTK